MKSSLMTALRTKFEKEEDGSGATENLDNTDKAASKAGSSSAPIVIDEEETATNGTHKPEPSPGAAVTVF